MSRVRPPVFRRIAASALTALCAMGSVHAAPARVAPASPATPVAAVLPDNPYGAIAPAADESDRSRDKGLRDTLMEVLKRVTGRSDAAFSTVLARASSLVQQYGFEKDPATQALQFRAVFDPAGVDEAIKRQGLPVFGVDADVVDAWTFDVRGVRSSRDYARLLTYLGGLRGVKRVDVDELRDDALRLHVTVEGGVSRMSALVAGGGVLRDDGTGSYVFGR